MAKYRAPRPKPKGPSPNAVRAVPCLILLLIAFGLLGVMFWGMLKG